jgi:hypothetical protein
MTRLLVKTSDVAIAEIKLTPGRNAIGREGDVDFCVPHPSVSRCHCEVWLTDDAVLVRDLDSRNGTFIEGERVQEAELTQGQTLRVGDIELLLADAPVRISVPDLPLPAQPKAQPYMPDGTPCCYHHEGIAAGVECTRCHKAFCTRCVRQLRVAGGQPRRFCPDCGGACEPLDASVKESKRPKWLDRIFDAFTKPTVRR